MGKHPHWVSRSQFERIRPHLPGSGSGRPAARSRTAAFFRGLSTVFNPEHTGASARRNTILNKTVHNRWKRWSERGVFTRIPEALGDPGPQAALLDSTAERAHRCASVGPQKAGRAGSGAPAVAPVPRSTRSRTGWAGPSS